MNTPPIKSLFLVLLFFLAISTVAHAQSITLGDIYIGPYGQGSTISVPFKVSAPVSGGNCLGGNTIYTVYLSDATGSFTSKTAIGTYTGVYTAFINGKIPATITPSINYKVRVETGGSPAIVSNESAAFEISSLPGTTASASSTVVNLAYPEVYGSSNGVDNTKYTFTNTSSAGTVVTANFYNELNQADEGTFPLATPKDFIAKAAHYTVTVKAVSIAGVSSTYSYLLMNNPSNTGFGVSGSVVVCLSGGAALTYNVDVSSVNGIQYNYPGVTYTVKWGDGSSTSIYTLCQLIASNGEVSHVYTRSSCGNTANTRANSFEVDLQSVNPYSGDVGSPVTTYAKVITPPVNSFNITPSACTNTAVTVTNTSNPGQDPSSNAKTCTNLSALYTWTLKDENGAIIENKNNYVLSQPYKYTFTAVGNYTVTLHLQNSNGLCAPADIVKTICIQDPPQPSFTLPATVTCVNTPYTPVNTSVNNSTCSLNPYKWVVTGPAPVTYGSGTTAASAVPAFVFTAAGTYNLMLEITSPGCGPIQTPIKTITVNAQPTVTLSPNALVCGNNRVLKFDGTTGITKTTFSGSTLASTGTYVWTVSGGAYSFTDGTTASSQFPHILFNDYAAYTVTATNTNTCGTGSATASQVITFQQAPTVSAGAGQQICEGAQAVLAGSITGNFTNFQWVGGTGTFVPDRTSTLTPTYIPSAAEISAGHANITLRVITPLAAPCNSIDDNVAINITKKETITSAATHTVCDGQNFNYTITSTNATATYSWAAALSSGTATGFSATGSGTTINDLITNGTTTDAVVTYTITPVFNGCTGNPFTLKVTVKSLPVVTATVANAVICSNQAAGITIASNQAGTTYTWVSTASAGISGNANQATPTANGSIQNILVNNGSTTGAVTYTITPLNGTCSGSPVTATVTIQPLPVTSVPGADKEVCNVTSYTLQGNSPAPGTGKWTLASAQTGVTFSDDSNPNATANGLVPGQTYQFKWTITASSTCPPSSNTVTIAVTAPTTGGILAGSAAVCAGSNNGTLTLSGQVGKVIRWEQSTDNGATWQVLPNLTATQNYLNLNKTTQYRAVVQNNPCSIQLSSVATITVNQQTIAANAGVDISACAATRAVLTGNEPAPFAGIWTQTAGPPAIIANPASAVTEVTGLTGGNLYKFTWTIKGIPPCADNSDEVQINNTNDVTASFTADKATGCGPLAVTFTNTSTVITGTTFRWDFGDGSPQSAAVSPQHTFLPRLDGKEATYTVSLNVVNNCVPRPPVTFTVKVSTAVPLATILPDNLSGCGSFVLNVENASPGNNAQYDFYLFNGSTQIQHIIKTDKSTATFNPIVTPAVKTYRLYMIVTDFCGNTNKSTEIPITVSPASFTPQMFIKNSASKGCAPFNVTFVNNSSGGDTFAYNIYDANNALIESVPAGKTDFAYAFNTAGVYFVSITGSDYCTSIESAPKIRVDVYTTPVPDMVADVKTGCDKLTVKFANLTAKDGNVPASSLKYDWDFGDGVHDLNFTPAPHTYTYNNSPYNVSLTVTNLATGCSNTVIKRGLITVNTPPGTSFTVLPDSVITIPYYHFSFADKTTGNLVSWRWTFGDGASSANQNPQHTYADTGSYKVTLKVVNQFGCDSTISHTVKIKGVPGQLYLPNAFTPDGLSIELRTFTVKGSGLATYRLQIFNNWGQLVWQSTKLSGKGEPTESWDGTFKGTPAPQGVYLWQASATFINGTEWKGMSYNNSLPKRTGSINLIR